MTRGRDQNRRSRKCPFFVICGYPHQPTTRHDLTPCSALSAMTLPAGGLCMKKARVWCQTQPPPKQNKDNKPKRFWRPRAC